jgi:hypothetical protein
VGRASTPNVRRRCAGRTRIFSPAPRQASPGALSFPAPPSVDARIGADRRNILTHLSPTRFVSMRQMLEGDFVAVNVTQLHVFQPDTSARCVGLRKLFPCIRAKFRSLMLRLYM